MPETLQPPLTHDELRGHLLDIQSVDPTSRDPGHNGDSHHPGNISYTSHAHLQDALDRVEAPLTEAVGDEGEHMLTSHAFEALLKDTDEVNRQAKDKINDLDSAIANRDEMISVVNDWRKKTYEPDEHIPEEALDPDRPITINDIFDYLDARQEETADRLSGRSDAALLAGRHQASTALLKNLIKIWEYEQPEAKAAWSQGSEPELPLDMGTEHNDRLFNGLHDRREEFRKLTERRVRRLGNEMLDAAGISTKRDAELGESMEGPGSVSTVFRETETADTGSPQPAIERPARSQTSQATVEQDRSAELFADVVRFAQGRTMIETNMFDGQRYMGDESHPDRSRIQIPPDVMRAETSKDGEWYEQPNEVVAFTQLTEPGGEGVGQEMVRFRYQFSPTSKTSMHLRNSYDRDAYSGMRFREGMGGRDGHLEVAVDLPASVARALQKQIEQDPSSARIIVKQLMLENNNGAVPREKIDDSKYYPPYDNLPRGRDGWHITLLTGEENSRGFLPGYESNHLPVNL